MSNETKVFGILGLLTLVGLIIGAVLLGGNPSENTPASTVEPQRLVVDYAPNRGNKDARVTIVEFSDYQCPACKAAYQDVERVINEYKDSINFVYRQFPLPSHKNAKNASYAAIAAGKQNKYWEMHLKLFENQEKWSELGNPKDTFVTYAKELGLNEQQFRTDMESNETFDLVNKEVNEGNAIGINSTPTFFINGQKYPGVLTYSQMKSAIDALLQ